MSVGTVYIAAMLSGVIWLIAEIMPKKANGLRSLQEFAGSVFLLSLCACLVIWFGFQLFVYIATFVSAVTWGIAKTVAGNKTEGFSVQIREYSGFLFVLAICIDLIFWLGFEFFLVIATLLTGVTWLLEIYLLNSLRKQKNKSAAANDNADIEPWYIEYSRSFFPILIFVLLLRSFIVEPFRIPTGSMIPTLLVGDFILVNKYTYGFRLPVLKTKVIEMNEPERGDIVVFRFPLDPKKDYIKRLIGLPGDTVAYKDKRIYINAEAVQYSFDSEYIKAHEAERKYIRKYQESLLDVEHSILLDSRDWPDNMSEVVVPEGHYFMMGDNRDASFDSRKWGFVPEENLVGKAFFVWMHLDFGGHGFDFSRIGETIR